jgi:hypothetical protein
MYGIIAVVCMVIWLQDRKIMALAEDVDAQDDALDDLWCDAARMDTEIEKETTHMREWADGIMRFVSGNSDKILSLKQDICGLKTGHDMEIVEARAKNAYSMVLGSSMVSSDTLYEITKRCNKCGFTETCRLVNDEVSKEDRNVLKYKFNIDVPETKPVTASEVAAQKKRKSK